jgi:alpha-glucosidase
LTCRVRIPRRDALRLRRSVLGELTWIDAPDGVLHLRRGADFECVVNFGPEPVPLPEQAELLLGSGPIVDGLLPTDTAAWLRRDS